MLLREEYINTWNTLGDTGWFPLRMCACLRVRESARARERERERERESEFERERGFRDAG
jgi:hypothetical protein